jgi:hypothetical protein
LPKENHKHTLLYQPFYHLEKNCICAAQLVEPPPYVFDVVSTQWKILPALYFVKRTTYQGHLSGPPLSCCWSCGRCGMEMWQYHGRIGDNQQKMASLDNLFDSLCSGGSFKRSKPKPKPSTTNSSESVRSDKQKNKRIQKDLNFFGDEEEAQPVKSSKIVKAVKDDDEKNEGSNTAAPAQNKQLRDEEVAAFRRRMRIKVDGDGCPPPISTFEELPFHDQATKVKKRVIEVIELSTWREPTPVQMQAIPALATGRDVVVSAPTGSGEYI